MPRRKRGALAVGTRDSCGHYDYQQTILVNLLAGVVVVVVVVVKWWLVKKEITEKG